RRFFPEACYPDEKITFSVQLFSPSYYRFCGVTLNASPSPQATFHLEKIHETSPQQGIYQRQYQFSATFTRRGEYTLAPTVVQSDYPFGLIAFQRSFDANEKILVLPSLISLPPEWWKIYERENSEGEQHPSVPSSLGDFSGLRKWTPSDLLHHIHWRASARHEQLLVQKFESPRQMELILLADFYDTDEERFEKTVSLVASMIDDLYHHLEKAHVWTQTRVQLVLLGKEVQTIDTLDTSDFYHNAMRALAVAERSGQPCAPSYWAEFSQRNPESLLLFVQAATYDTVWEKVSPSLPKS
ncbi:MAG: DUF58 domain-containing protein, partial [Planctomycetia bacterium]|nr:DUF58 domain-containing protein [Planctomycetia bacterium]